MSLTTHDQAAVRCAMRTSWFSQADDEEIYHVLNLFLEEIKDQLREKDAGQEARGQEGEGSARANEETTKPPGPVDRVINRLRASGWLAEHKWPDKGLRERIYPLLWRGINRGFVFLKPPREEQLEEQIAKLYRLPDRERIRVIPVRGRSALDHVAAAGAGIVLDLIRQLGKGKKPGERVHVAWGAGGTSRYVAKHLAELLEKEASYPPLTLHALTSGFLVEEPGSAPVTFFGFFDEDRLAVNSVGLFSQAVVPCDRYEEVKGAFGVKRSFELADQIEICISSLATAADEHSLFKQFLKDYAKDRPAEYAEMLRYLKKLGWCGDVQYLPYSKDGPIPLVKGIRAVTLFELPQLVERAASGERYLVLVAVPCPECNRTRTDALIPLLENPSLRVWSHLVCDVQTAEELIHHKQRAT